MKAYSKVWQIQEMARVFEVTRSGYYQFLKVGLSSRAQANQQLLVAIKEV
jgi:hypothetical protein